MISIGRWIEPELRRCQDLSLLHLLLPGCVRWPLLFRFSFAGSNVRTRQNSHASDADRVRLVDAGGAGLRGRFAASSVVAGLDMVGFLSRRHRGCSCRYGDILRSERAFNIRRQGQNGRIPCRSSAWLQLASSAALGRGPPGRRQLSRTRTAVSLARKPRWKLLARIARCRRACSRV